jgi:hypothetical protein
VRDAGDADPENQKAKAPQALKIAQKLQKAFPYTRSRFHKHCTPPEWPFCPHTALLSLAIHQGALRKIALPAEQKSSSFGAPCLRKPLLQNNKKR